MQLKDRAAVPDVRLEHDRFRRLKGARRSDTIPPSSRLAIARLIRALALVIAVLTTSAVATAAWATSPREWSTPVVIDAHGSHANQVTYSASCPSATFCVVADGNGNVTLGRNGRWMSGQPVKAGGSFDSVSCPTSTHCVAIAGGGANAVTFNGYSWSPALRMGPEATYKISCPTSGFCAAVGASGNPGGSSTIALLRGRTWSSHQVSSTGARDDRLMDVSCAAPTFCVAVNLNGQRLTFNGVKWTSIKSAGPNGLISISCVTPTFCLAVTDTGQSMTFNGTRWTTPRAIPLFSSSFAYSVSCSSSIYCVVPGLNGYAVSWSSGKWSPPARVFLGGVSAGVAVSCSPSRTCLAVNDKGFSSAN